MTEATCINTVAGLCKNKFFKILILKDTDSGECKACSTVYADCNSCKKVGTDILCYSCANNYLKSDKKGCIADCAADSTYAF